jgi:hypothetical protein
MTVAPRRPRFARRSLASGLTPGDLAGAHHVAAK